MPYIDVNVSCGLSADQENALKTSLGEAISEIPGKSEGSLMIQFKDNCRLWMGGSNDDSAALVNVMLLGYSTKDAYRSLADKIIAMLGREAGIAASNIYVKYEEVPNWFWG